MEFSPKQKVFLKEYLVDLNGTQAAIRAGYSARTANEQAARLLAKASVKKAIKAEMDKRAERTDLTIDRVLLEYKRIALFDIRKAFDQDGVLKPVHEWDDDTAAAIAGLEAEELYSKSAEERENIGRLSKVKLADKRAALCDVMKHLGGFSKDNEQKGEAEAKATSATVLAAMSLREASEIYKEKTKLK